MSRIRFLNAEVIVTIVEDDGENFTAAGNLEPLITWKMAELDALGAVIRERIDALNMEREQ